MALPGILFTLFLLRFHYLRGSFRLLIASFLAGGLGLILWMKVVGPLVLPKKGASEPESVEQAAEVGDSK